MNLKEALLTQAPSLALQRAAADEIARLTKLLEEAHERIDAFYEDIEHDQEELK